MKALLALVTAALLGAAAAGATAYVVLDERLTQAERRVETVGNVRHAPPVAPPAQPAQPAQPIEGETTSIEVDTELLQIMNERIRKLEYKVQLLCETDGAERTVVSADGRTGVETCS